MKDIHHKMREELTKATLFENAKSYGLDYLQHIFDRNVFPTEKAVDNLKHFDEPLPQTSSKALDVLQFLNQFGADATVAQTGGRYFGFVAGGVLPIALASKILSSFWDQNTPMYANSPFGTKLEMVVEKWLQELFNFSDKVVSGFVSGSSSANFCGLAAARYRLLKKMDWDINEKGLFEAPKIRIVTGKNIHSSVIRAIGLLGFGKNSIEWVDTDKQGRVMSPKLPQLDQRTIVILQAGDVNTGAFDDFETICEMATQHGAWVHVDGAFGLWARGVKKFEAITKGMEKADSWTVDAHKTLNTPYDCGLILCKDKEALASALHMSGDYIILNKQRDGMCFTPEMSKRARAVELWAVLKYLGREGIEEMIYTMHLRALQFQKELSILKGFYVVNEVTFNQVLVRCEDDLSTKKVIEKVQEMRECWVGGSMWGNKKVIRISVCSWATTKEDVSRSVKSFEKALQETIDDKKS